MSFLEMLIKQSPWLLDSRAIRQDVHLLRLGRFPLIYHETKFLDHKFVDGVYIITGPRQIGKSTHLKMLIKKLIHDDNKENFLYFNCDLLESKKDIVALVDEYLSAFPSKHRRYIFLDEITSVKDSMLAIKFLIDSGYSENLTYILTSSNTISIKKTGEYLPGRRGKGVDFNFTPISFRDYLNLLYPKESFKLSPDLSEKEFVALKKGINLEKHLNEYLMTGGLPRVINEYYLNKDISDDIYTIYRFWLISEIAKADRREHIAKRMLDRVMLSLGSDISYAVLAQEAEVGSHNTVYDYLDFFESTYILSLVYNFDISQKQVKYRKNKKIYFNDPFIYAVVNAWLTGKVQQDFDYLQSNILKSQLIENLVYLKLKSSNGQTYFYKSSREIDFVNDKYLVEVKYQNKIVANDYDQLQRFNGNKIVVTKNRFGRDKNVLLLPVEYFLLIDF